MKLAAVSLRAASRLAKSLAHYMPGGPPQDHRFNPAATACRLIGLKHFAFVTRLRNGDSEKYRLCICATHRAAASAEQLKSLREKRWDTVEILALPSPVAAK